jgi:uncharacterized phiE125 gp8 family phage protein
MISIVKVAIAPASEPVTLADTKIHLRVDHAADDTLISRLIAAARQQCELTARRAFITRTLDLRLPAMPGALLEIPTPPLLAITSISYVASTGATATVDAGVYHVYADIEPGAIVLKPYQNWPAVDLMPGWPVTIRYTAGYGTTPAAVPQCYQQAIMLLVSHWYENREAVTTGAAASELPFAVQMLLTGDRREWWPQ